MSRPHHSTSRTDPFAFPHGQSLSRSYRGHLFRAEGGEVCATLDSRWDELLGEMRALGPVALITHNEQVRLATLTPAVDFVREPTGNAFLELSTGLCVDESDWAYALAVEEELPAGAIFGFQFFDHYGRGQLKVLLTRQAQLEHFLQMIERYGVRGCPDGEDEGLAPAQQEAIAPAPVPDRDVLKALWPVTRHEMGGRFFPGLPGVSRLSALRAVGNDDARPMLLDTLVGTLLKARRKRLPFEFTLYSQRLTHGATLRARRLERCPRGLHLFDEASEMHLFPDHSLLYWLIRHQGSYAIELIRNCGQRGGFFSAASGREEGWNALMEKL